MRRRSPTPPEDSFDLISACLATAEDPRLGAWAILAEVPEILRDPAVRRAGLMPQLLHAADISGVELAPEVRSVLRVASVREELRTAAVAEACREFLDLDGGQAIVLRGVALAYSVYDSPELRHCHDLDVLLRTTLPASAHASGFQTSAHVSLFSSPRRRVSFEDVAPVTIRAEIAGVPARVMAPAEALVHLCAHPAIAGQLRNPLWCVDAGLLIKRSEALDWERVVDRAVAWNVAAVTGQALGLLHHRLDLPVPATALRALSTRRVRLRALAQRRLRIGAVRA